MLVSIFLVFSNFAENNANQSFVTVETNKAYFVFQIQGRFQVLMKLLEKVASGSHDNYPA